MSLGITPTKSDVDSLCGGLARDLKTTLSRIVDAKLWLDTKTDANLLALGYVQGEVDSLRSAYVDLNKLAGIFNATQTQATTYDFKTFAKLLYGFGI